MSATDYNLHEVFLHQDQQQFFKRLWLMEVMQPSFDKPFKHKHLISIYNNLKMHAKYVFDLIRLYPKILILFF